MALGASTPSTRNVNGGTDRQIKRIYKHFREHPGTFEIRNVESFSVNSDVVAPQNQSRSCQVRVSALMPTNDTFDSHNLLITSTVQRMMIRTLLLASLAAVSAFTMPRNAFVGRAVTSRYVFDHWRCCECCRFVGKRRQDSWMRSGTWIQCSLAVLCHEQQMMSIVLGSCGK